MEFSSVSQQHTYIFDSNEKTYALPCLFSILSLSLHRFYYCHSVQRWGKTNTRHVHVCECLQYFPINMCKWLSFSITNLHFVVLFSFFSVPWPMWKQKAKWTAAAILQCWAGISWFSFDSVEGKLRTPQYIWMLWKTVEQTNRNRNRKMDDENDVKARKKTEERNEFSRMIQAKRKSYWRNWLDVVCLVRCAVCACLDPYGLAGGRSHFYCHKNEIYDRPRMQLHNLCDDETNKQTNGQQQHHHTKHDQQHIHHKKTDLKQLKQSKFSVENR